MNRNSEQHQAHWLVTYQFLKSDQSKSTKFLTQKYKTHHQNFEMDKNIWNFKPINFAIHQNIQNSQSND